MDTFQLLFIILKIFDNLKYFFCGDSPQEFYLPRTRSPHILEGSKSFLRPAHVGIMAKTSPTEISRPCQRSSRERKKFWAEDCWTWKRKSTLKLLQCLSSLPEGY